MAYRSGAARIHPTNSADLKEGARGLRKHERVERPLIPGERKLLAQDVIGLGPHRELLLQGQSAERRSDVARRHLDFVHDHQSPAGLDRPLQLAQEDCASAHGQKHQHQEAHREIEWLVIEANRVGDHKLRRAFIPIRHLAAFFNS